jgi:hypothetical protein
LNSQKTKTNKWVVNFDENENKKKKKQIRRNIRKASSLLNFKWIFMEILVLKWQTIIYNVEELLNSS